MYYLQFCTQAATGGLAVLKKTREKDTVVKNGNDEIKIQPNNKAQRARIKNQSFTYNLFSRVFWRSS